MDALTFIAELVKAAAWPVAAVVIALIFRDQLRALLARVRKGKVGPAEFEFEQQVQELASQDSLQQPANVLPAPTVTLATEHPRAAIIDTWLQLEGVANRIAFPNATGPSAAPTPRTTPLSMINALRSSGRVPAEDIALLNELRILRNQATHDHDFSPSPESVIRYVQLAQGLKDRLERLAVER